jgi:hypothetical protein
MRSCTIYTEKFDFNILDKCFLFVIKFVSELRQAGGFPWVLQFPPPIKLTNHDITEILLKVELNTINHIW